MDPGYDRLNNLLEENKRAAMDTYRSAPGLGRSPIPGYANGGPMSYERYVVDMNFRIDPWRQPHRANVPCRRSLELELRAMREYRARCGGSW